MEEEEAGMVRPWSLQQDHSSGRLHAGSLGRDACAQESFRRGQSMSFVHQACWEEGTGVQLEAG
jgi:hypothetical protein